MTIFRFGDQGEGVGLLQRRLARAGFAVEASHCYDEATEDAVRRFQARMGLVVDGIAGPKTLAALAAGRRGPKLLTDADLVAAAGKLDVPLACVRAVNEVESRGRGFLDDGRPVILFERHVFWQRLAARGIDPESHAARSPDVLSRKPGGYRGGAAEHERLASACRIGKDAAHEAASWGAFQVMGHHWRRLDYADVDTFVLRMWTDEAEHLDAFVRFVAADSVLLSALRARRWARFARGYNGPGYARHLYDVRLARAYERYARQEDDRRAA